MTTAALFAQVILLPVHLIMAWLYWRLIRARCPAAGNGFDGLIIFLAAASWVLVVVWGFGSNPPGAGRIWPFVLATPGFCRFYRCLVARLSIPPGLARS